MIEINDLFRKKFVVSFGIYIVNKLGKLEYNIYCIYLKSVMIVVFYFVILFLICIVLNDFFK